MTTAEKFEKVFEAGWFIFENHPRHVGGGEWKMILAWKHVIKPGDTYIKDSKWEGFDNIDECLDDCLEYIETLKNEKPKGLWRNEN